MGAVESCLLFFFPFDLYLEDSSFDSGLSALTTLAVDVVAADVCCCRFFLVMMCPLTAIQTSSNSAFSRCSKGEVTLLKESGSDAMREAVCTSSIDIIPLTQSFRSLVPSDPISMMCDEISSSFVTLIAISVRRRRNLDQAVIC